MKQLGAHIFQIDLGKANVFLLESKDGLTLVDTAVVGIRDRLEARLVKRGFRLGDIRRILVTHAHVDHIGGLKDVQAATGAQVWAHHLEAPFVRGEADTLRPELAALAWKDRLFARLTRGFVGDEQPSAPVHRLLKDGEALTEVLPGLRVLHLPGHSPGQIGFWLEPERLLIGGDVMLHPFFRLTRPIAAYTPDMPEAERSILKVAALGVQTLGVGHGPALIGNAEAAINRLAQKIIRQQAQESV